jgi:DNA-binding CsgD family transcriptional regulator
MTPREKPADHPGRPGWIANGDPQTIELENGRSSPERARAANEVGSAIAHQLNGPLTALRLYVGEIRQNSDRFPGTAGAQAQMQKMVEGAFQETERVCAMMRLITDSFEEPLCPETAAALGRDVIGWLSRSAGTNGNGDAHGCGAGESAPLPSIHELLTPRERETLGHISQGCSNKQGAKQMQIGPRTFESHRAGIMRKLGARNGADLVRIVLGEKSVTL